MLDVLGLYIRFGWTTRDTTEPRAVLRRLYPYEMLMASARVKVKYIAVYLGQWVIGMWTSLGRRRTRLSAPCRLELGLVLSTGVSELSP